MPAKKPEQTKSAVFLKVLLCFGFFLTGIATVLIGQILPHLASRSSLADNEAARFFVAQFSGSLAGTLAVGTLVRRAGFRLVLPLGFALAALGVFLLDSIYLPAAFAAFVFLGAGIGLTIPAVNLLTVELNREKTASALNVVNFFWGFGAILCKPFLDFFRGEKGGDLFAPLFILAASLLFAGAAFGFTGVSTKENAKSEIDGAEKDDEKFLSLPVWTTSTAWLIAAFNFLHVGLETGIGGWTTTYALRLPEDENSFANVFPAASVFFLFLVIGRAAAPLFLKFLTANTLLLCGLLTMLAGICLLLAAEDLRFLTVGAGIAGFGSSAIFPTNMSRFVQIFGAKNAAGKATPLFVAGTLGGAAISYSIGFVSAQTDDLRAGMFVLLGGCAVLIILQIVLSNAKREKHQ